MVQIFREVLAAGQARGGPPDAKAKRDETTVLRADYALFYKANIPLAAVEARTTTTPWAPEWLRPSTTRGCWKCPSASSNGDGFVFRDATLADGVLERT